MRDNYEYILYTIYLYRYNIFYLYYIQHYSVSLDYDYIPGKIIIGPLYNCKHTYILHLKYKISNLPCIIINIKFYILVTIFLSRNSITYFYSPYEIIMVNNIVNDVMTNKLISILPSIFNFYIRFIIKVYYTECPRSIYTHYTIKILS